MVGPEGFEPSPGGLKVRCAKPLTLRSRIGPCGRNRTGNLLIKSQLRYQLRHTGLVVLKVSLMS